MDPSVKYKLLEQVGNGSFGVVYKAVHKETGEVVAIKEVPFPLRVGPRQLTSRLILRAATTTLQRFSRRSPC